MQDEGSNIQTQQSLSYSSFEDLQKSSLTNFEQLFDHINQIRSNDQEWLQQFQTTNDLRSINKYNPEQFRTFLQTTYKEENNFVLNVIGHWCNSLRSNVQKNCLMLYKEIFKHNQIEDFNTRTLTQLFSKVFEKVESDYKFLRQEAQLAINIVIDKKFTKFEESIIDALFNIAQAQANKTQQQAFPVLVKIIQKMNYSIPLSEIWLKVLKLTSTLSNGKSLESRKSSEELIKYLSSQLELWEAVTLLLGNSNDIQVLTILNQIKEKKSNTNSQKSKGLTQFLVNKKLCSIAQEEKQTQQQDVQ